MIRNMMIILMAATLIGSLAAPDAVARGRRGVVDGNGTRGGHAVHVNPGHAHRNGLINCGYAYVPAPYNCYPYGVGI